MTSILGELPTKEGLQQSLDGKFSLSVSNPLGGVDVAKMGSDISKLQPGDSTLATLPSVPPELSPSAVQAKLNAPLQDMTAINSRALTSSITANPLPISLPKPGFDVNGTVGNITNKIIPSSRLPVPSADLSVPGLDGDEFLRPLRKLGEAGATTPLRLLHMLLQIAQRLKETVTDPDKLTELTSEALSDIYIAQLKLVQGHLSIASLDEASTILSSGFLAQYERALSELESLQQDAFLDTVPRHLLPSLRRLGQARVSFEELKARDLTQLQAALQKLLNLAASDEVFFQPYFKAFEDKVTPILEQIVEPVNQLKDMAVAIRDYLNKAAEQAEGAAKKLAETLEKGIVTIEQALETLRVNVEAVTKQIEAFLAKVDVGAVVVKVKQGINAVGGQVLGFFNQVEEIKQRLEDAVEQIRDQLDEKLGAAFKEAELKIRELLGQISAILERPEVKDALAKARQGIETFKNKIGEASLKPVFDLIIQETAGLETKVRRIEVERMGTPQKTALKIGAKIIREVKVDEIVKPELVEAFRQIRQPLQELIQLLKDKVLVIEQTINDFNPGTLATDLILNSSAYQSIIRTLEEIKPSRLLAPLKQANAKLADIVAQLDPQLIIDEAQKLYERLYELVDMLSPAALNELIGKALDQVVFQLKQVRDYELDTLVDEVKRTISIERLLEGTGLQEIAKADFWEMLSDILGGGYLDAVGKAMTDVEKELTERARALDFSAVLPELQRTIAAVEAQIAATPSVTTPKIEGLKAILDASQTTIDQLQARRQRLLADYKDQVGVADLLGLMDLAPLAALNVALADLLALTSSRLGDSLRSFRDPLADPLVQLKQMDEAFFEGVVPGIFKRQIGDPVRQLVQNLQAKLMPFREAITAIKGIIETVAALPAKIDAIVGGLLDQLKTSLVRVINQVLATIESFRATLSSTVNAVYTKVKEIVDAFNPTWILNMFAEGDFKQGAGGAPTGLLSIARRVRAPEQDTIAQLIQGQLSVEELVLLRAETDSLGQANQRSLIKALNAALLSPQLAERARFDAVHGALERAIAEVTAQLAVPTPKGGLTADEQAARLARLQTLYRSSALKGQLEVAWSRYTGIGNKRAALIRLNRVILEAWRQDDIGVSVQSLHPYLVQQVGHLYPERAIQALDAMYVEIIETIKQLPDRLIRAPLDDEFKKVKSILLQNFDIAGLFDALDLKLSGMDQDLSTGLDRLSVAYNRLLTTFDERLS